MNDILISYDNLSQFYNDLKIVDLAAKQDALTAGSNILISGSTISVDGYVYDVDETLFTGATLTVDGTQKSIVASGTTAITWDSLSASIPTGKTIDVTVVAINTGNSALQLTMSGSYHMMGDGNITIQPNELGLYKAKYISAVNVWLVEAINQEVSSMIY